MSIWLFCATLAAPPAPVHLSAPEILPALFEAHALLHGPHGIDADGVADSQAKLKLLQTRLAGDPTTLNKEVRRRVLAAEAAIGASKPEDADALLHQLYTFLSRPPAVTRPQLKATLIELDAFLHDTRPDAARRCQSAMRDHLDLLELDKSDLAKWAQEWFTRLIALLEKGQVAAADERIHVLIEKLK